MKPSRAASRHKLRRVPSRLFSYGANMASIADDFAKVQLQAAAATKDYVCEPRLGEWCNRDLPPSGLPLARFLGSKECPAQGSQGADPLPPLAFEGRRAVCFRASV